MTIQTPAILTGDGTTKSLSTWIGIAGAKAVWFQLTYETGSGPARVGGATAAAVSSTLGIPFGGAFSSAQFVPQASQPYNPYDLDNIFLFIPNTETVSMGYAI